MCTVQYWNIRFTYIYFWIALQWRRRNFDVISGHVSLRPDQVLLRGIKKKKHDKEMRKKGLHWSIHICMYLSIYICITILYMYVCYMYRFYIIYWTCINSSIRVYIVNPVFMTVLLDFVCLYFFFFYSLLFAFFFNFVAHTIQRSR